MKDQHLLRFAYCAVSQTDNLHLLLCVVLLLVQFGDAANVTSHFFFLCVCIYIPQLDREVSEHSDVCLLKMCDECYVSFVIS